EPGRAGRHLPAARGAARPLPAQGADRLSLAGRRGAHGRCGQPGAHGRRLRPVAGRAGAGRRRHRRDAARHRAGHARRRRCAVRGAHRRGHAQVAGHRPGRRPARQPGAGARGARAGGADGPRLRHPRRHPRDRQTRAAPPHRAGAGAADRRPGSRPGAARAAGQGGSAAAVRPAPLLVVAFVAWAALGVAASFGWLPARAWPLAGAAIAVAALLDLLRLRRRATPEVARELPEALPIGIEREVTLQIESGPRRQRVDVFDLHPGGWESTGLPRSLLLPPDTVSSFGYRLRPTARGDFRFEGVQLRLLSPWRLWRQSRIAGVPQPVRVFPNFAPLARFALLSAEQASRIVGAHLKRRRGEGTAFHQMREYRVGDRLRQIDWKATARARKLISREYQDEKNQQLIVVLDTGRRMLARDGALAHFDHALDASLVVSYLALRQGDAVGLYATGGDERWVAP